MRMAKAHAIEGWLGVTKVYVAEKEEMSKRFGFPQPQADSSSISSEQTFEEWWLYASLEYSGEEYEAARAAWAAAKGSTETKGSR